MNIKLSNYVGIPFLDRGRSFKGCDCYGLIKLYYENELNIIIPEVIAIAEQPKKIMLTVLNQTATNWEEVKKPAKHSVVVMNMHEHHPKLITHVGVMIDEKRMLHTLKECKSHILSIDDIKVSPFVRGFYQWLF